MLQAASQWSKFGVPKMSQKIIKNFPQPNACTYSSLADSYYIGTTVYLVYNIQYKSPYRKLQQYSPRSWGMPCSWWGVRGCVRASGAPDRSHIQFVDSQKWPTSHEVFSCTVLEELRGSSTKNSESRYVICFISRVGAWHNGCKYHRWRNGLNYCCP